MVSIYNKQHYAYFTIVFAASVIFSPFYYLGDQEHYRLFYNSLAGKSLSGAYSDYGSALGSKEPIYFLLVYYLSGIFDKDILFSLMNGFLSASLVRWMIGVRVNSLAIFFVIITSFYLFVLFFAAERLKVSIMLFLFGVNVTRRCKGIFYILSMFAHAQMILGVILVTVRVGVQTAFDMKRGSVRRSFLFIAAIGFIAVVFVSHLMMDHLVSKFMFYVEKGGLSAIFKPFLFGIFTAMFVKSRLRYEVSVVTAILCGAAFFVGEERLVIFSYAVSLFYLLQIKRGLNFPVLLLCCYFGIKNFNFLANVLIYGHGFPFE